MKKLSYRITGGLEEQDCRLMHQKALQVLKKVGILVLHDEVLDILKRQTGIKVEGKTVYFEEDLVNRISSDIKEYPFYKYKLAVGGYSQYYLDPATGKVRTSQYDDLVTSIRIADALDMDVVAPVVPLDLHPDDMEMAMFKAVYENSRKPHGGGQVTLLKTAEAYYEMSKLLNVPYSLELWAISPLKIDSNHLDIILKFKDRSPDIWLCNVPLRCVSAPFGVDAAFIQSIAECLGAGVIAKLISPNSNIYFRGDAFFLYAFDMATSNLSWCSPHFAALILMQNQLAKFYGVTPMGKTMCTMSKEPDAQACFEKGMNTLLAAMFGSENFAAAGTLGGDDIFSPEQMLLDKEMFQQIMDFMKFQKFEVDIDNVDLNSMAEVGHGGSYFDHDSTLDNFHSILYTGKYFDQDNVNVWLNKGTRPIREKVRDHISKMKLNEEGVLRKEVHKELDKIYDFFAVVPLKK